MLYRALGRLALSTHVAALACAACSPSPSTTRTTSAQKYAAGSPDLRTVDNAGYVDPGGRTHQVSAGGTTTTGRGAPAVPPPRREAASGRSETTATETAAPPPEGIPSSSADPTELRERAARSLCDRESYCERVGAGKTFESSDACMVAKRERVRLAMSKGGCHEIRGEAVSRCLTAIRGAECGEAGTPLPPPTACTSDVLCK